MSFRKLSDEEKRFAELNLDKLKDQAELLDYEERILDFNVQYKYPMEQKLAQQKLMRIRKYDKKELQRSVDVLSDQIKNGVEVLDKKRG